MGRPQKIPHTVGLSKSTRKERKQFTPEEDERLLEGFFLHGPCWTRISKDANLGLQNRRSTDLRDRFRNAFPERYAAAGFKLKNNPGNRSKYYQNNMVNDATTPNDSSTTEAAAAAVAAVAAVAASNPNASPQQTTEQPASDELLDWPHHNLPSQFFTSQRNPNYSTDSFLLGQSLSDPFNHTLQSFHPYESLFSAGQPPSLPISPSTSQNSVQPFPFSIQQPPLHLEPPLSSNTLNSSTLPQPNSTDFNTFPPLPSTPRISSEDIPWDNRG